MTPQARLQPSALMSMWRISERPTSATLNEPVEVRTMIKPNNTSAMRSCGSSTRLEDLIESSGIGKCLQNVGGKTSLTEHCAVRMIGVRLSMQSKQ